MGSWTIVISGVGQHDNAKHPCDVDVLAPNFVEQLLTCGQIVTTATLTIGYTVQLMKEGDVPPIYLEQLTAELYTRYCKEVGGVAFNGDPLPGWYDFRNDPAKQKQVNAWLVVGALAARK